MSFRNFLPALFAVLCAAVLLSTPLVAGFQLRAFACDLGPSPDWTETLLNWKHLISYGALATIGFLALSARPFWVAAVILLLVMAGTELTQGVFDDGHCRLRDMLPNVIAVCIGGLVAQGIKSVPRRKARL